MGYKFVVEMRETKEIIVLCEWDNLKFFETLMSYFDEGNYISRFAILENDVIIKEKVLPPKQKRLVRRKQNEKYDSK